MLIRNFRAGTSPSPAQSIHCKYWALLDAFTWSACLDCGWWLKSQGGDARSHFALPTDFISPERKTLKAIHQGQKSRPRNLADPLPWEFQYFASTVALFGRPNVSTVATPVEH